MSFVTLNKLLILFCTKVNTIVIKGTFICYMINLIRI